VMWYTPPRGSTLRTEPVSWMMPVNILKSY